MCCARGGILLFPHRRLYASGIQWFGWYSDDCPVNGLEGGPVHELVDFSAGHVPERGNGEQFGTLDLEIRECSCFRL